MNIFLSILLSKRDAQIAKKAGKCLIVKQANSTKSSEIFSPGEYAILSNIICVQVKEK